MEVVLYLVIASCCCEPLNGWMHGPQNKRSSNLVATRQLTVERAHPTSKRYFSRSRNWRPLCQIFSIYEALCLKAPLRKNRSNPNSHSDLEAVKLLLSRTCKGALDQELD